MRTTRYGFFRDTNDEIRFTDLSVGHIQQQGSTICGVPFRLCLQHQRWREQGLPPIRMGVNLSSLQFRDQDWVVTIDNVLKEGMLEPQYLELELTEGIVMRDVEESWGGSPDSLATSRTGHHFSRRLYSPRGRIRTH